MNTSHFAQASYGPAGSGKWLQSLHEVLFSVNLAFALGLAILLRIFSYRSEGHELIPISALKYFFLRGAVRINYFSHLSIDNTFGRQAAFSMCVVGIALIVLAFTRIFHRPAFQRFLFGTFAGATSLFAVPAAILTVLLDEGTRSEMFGSSGPGRVMLRIAIAEAVCALILLVVSRKWRASVWMMASLLLFHFALWIPMVWIGARERFIVWPALCILMISFPASGFTWLAYIRRLPLNTVQDDRSIPSKLAYAVAMGTLGFVILLLVWSPAWNPRLGSAADISGATIEMSRSACFGRCPVYTIEISGNGIVRYTGEQNVAVVGNESRNISPEQVSGLLEDFDSINFFSLDDRAFEECSDTPNVTVSLSLGGRHKTITSNVYCTGARPGPQYSFVNLTEKIDAVVGTNSWIGRTTPSSK